MLSLPREQSLNANAEQGPDCQISHAQCPDPPIRASLPRQSSTKKAGVSKAVAVSSSHFLQVASPQDLALQMARSPQHILLLSILTENQTQDLPSKREIDGSTVYAEQMLKAALRISTLTSGAASQSIPMSATLLPACYEGHLPRQY